MLQIYKASAGSGKTFTLAREYIRLLLSADERDARAHSRILAVTFTKKATAEMKDRILRELYTLATDPTQSDYYDTFLQQLRLTASQMQKRAQERLQQVLMDYTHFSVSTIDGFFQQIVRCFARELGLPATYNITLDSKEVIDRAVDDLVFAAQKSQDEAGRWLTDFAMQNIAQGKRWNPREAVQEISTQLLTEQLQTELAAIRPLLTNKELLRTYKATLQQYIDRYEQAEWKRKRKLTDEQETIKRDRFTAEAILDNLDALGLMSDVAAQIQLTNQAENRLPISDINLLLNRVIDHSDTPFIYEKIGSRLHHYMIDEFQDTSTLQWENFRPLVSEANDNGRDNLIVGDTKQSIYRWRNSDWHLLEGVEHEIQPAVLPPMDTNFRSSHVIVDANNDIFRRYANHVDGELSAIDPALGASVRHAYSTLFQNAKRQNLSGRMEIQFLDTERPAEAAEIALEAMLPVIENCHARGVQYGDIAVLIRNAREAQAVTQMLITSGYKVQSADGLLIAAHPAIELLTSLLRLSQTPQDDLVQARARLTMAQHLYADPQQAIEVAMSSQELFTDEQRALIHQAATLPLYEQVQTLIDGLRLHEWEAATSYVTSFMDVVYQYTENNIADTGSFLEYWQRRCDQLSIPSSPTRDAIQIMTIHKSKGLEFDMVLMPYLSWPIAAGTMDSRKLLWVKPKSSPFDALPLVPVGCTRALAKTEFADEYNRELRDLYLDNLNLTYVAFTRPKRELYAWAQIPRTKADGNYSLKNVGNLLYLLLKNDLEEDIYIRGTQESLLTPEDGQSTDITVRTAEYRSAEMGTRLRLSTHAREDAELSLQDFGTLMHDLLAEIETREDAETAIAHYIYSGRAREEDEPRMREQLEQFWALIADRDWFNGGYRVLREQDILSPGGEVYRPDRVMIRDGHATVIDYKFGEHRSKTHIEQVRNYMTLLGQMGYTTSGYLVYVTLHTIEPV